MDQLGDDLVELEVVGDLGERHFRYWLGFTTIGSLLVDRVDVADGTKVLLLTRHVVDVAMEQMEKLVRRQAEGRVLRGVWGKPEMSRQEGHDFAAEWLCRQVGTEGGTAFAFAEEVLDTYDDGVSTLEVVHDKPRAWRFLPPGEKPGRMVWGVIGSPSLHRGRVSTMLNEAGGIVGSLIAAGVYPGDLSLEGTSLRSDRLHEILSHTTVMLADACDGQGFAGWEGVEVAQDRIT